MAVKIINKFDGQISTDFCGTWDSDLYNQTFYILDNGSAKRSIVEKRPGSLFVIPTLDGGPSRLIDTVNKTLILNPKGITTYNKKSESIDSTPLAGAVPGTAPKPLRFEGKDLVFDSAVSNLAAGDYIVLGGRDAYEIVGVSGGDRATLSPLFGDEFGPFYDTAVKISVSASPWTQDQIAKADFVDIRTGVLVLNQEVSPRLISYDGAISEPTFSGIGFPPYPFSGVIYSNRLFLLTRTGAENVQINVSRVGSYYDFTPAANDAQAPMRIDPGFIRAVDARWIKANSMGVIVGSAEGIHFLRNKAGIGIFDATLPNYIRTISDIGAHDSFPMVHSDSLFFASEEGKGLAVAKPMPYYEETNVKVSRVSDYSDAMTTFGPVVKITRASSEVHFMYALTSEGTIVVIRPSESESSTSAFISTWSVGHFDSKYLDVERMRYDSEKDALMFVVRRGMRTTMKYFVEILRFHDPFPKPEYFEDYYVPTNTRLESRYYSVVIEMLTKYSWLDASTIYHASRGRPAPDLTVTSDILSSAIDLFEPEDVGETIISAEGFHYTFKEFIDKKTMRFFNIADKPSIGTLTGWRYVTDKIPASQLLDNDTHSLVLMADGRTMFEERHRPGAIDTDYIAVYKFRRDEGYIISPIKASVFTIGIPYRFTYVTNPIKHMGFDRDPPVTEVRALCVMAGDFFLGTSDSDARYIEKSNEPKRTPFYSVEYKYADVLSDVCAPAVKIKIAQESCYPLSFTALEITLS